MDPVLCDASNISCRLLLLEKLVGELHWCFIGQFVPQYMHAPDPRASGNASDSDENFTDIESPRISPAKRRRRRAKSIKERMWAEINDKRQVKDHGQCQAACTQTSIVDTADLRCLPNEAWTPIYEKFSVRTSSGTVLSIRAANVIKLKLLRDEAERLQDLRNVIAEYIRSSDGSEATRRDISAMTSAMSNATSVVKHASTLSVYDFFHECPLKTCRM
jgi:hypothetical protein